jgi:DNA (cytosine-5)-methyltransferase 1
MSVDFEKENNKKLKVVSLFSGCGGLDLGFEKTGKFEVVCATDIWDTALKTIKLNNPKVETICKPLQDISDDDILKIKEKNGEIEVVIGGPPCQGFSLAGKRNVEDPRNSLWREFVRVVSIIKPTWFVMENVFGLLSMSDKNGKKVSESIQESFSEIGYSVVFNSISAKNFNVPQDRKRLVIIGNKNGIELKLKPTTENNYKTVRDVISDLDSLKSGEISITDKYHFAMKHNENHINWLKPVPEGETAHNYKHITGMKVKGYSTTYKRIWWDRPSPAITTCFSSISSQNNVHPRDTRALTIREAMRIQTFPDDFTFVGNHKDIRTQIGNAVPPELGRQIALQILNFEENKSNPLL